MPDTAEQKRAKSRDWQIRLQKACADRDLAHAGAWSTLLRMQAATDKAVAYMGASANAARGDRSSPVDPLLLRAAVAARYAETLRLRIELYRAAAELADAILKEPQR